MAQFFYVHYSMTTVQNVAMAVDGEVYQSEYTGEEVIVIDYA